MGKQRRMLIGFGNGFWGRRFDGRLDLEGYNSALKEITNFIPMPGGEAQKRPGLKFVKTGKSTGRQISASFSDNNSYVIGLIKNGFHLYKATGIETLTFVSTTTDANLYKWVDDPAASDAFPSVYEIDVVQVGDALYLMNEEMQTLKMQYDGSGFKTAPIDFADRPPYRLLQKAKTLTAINADMQSGTEAVGGAKFIKIKGDFSNVNGGTLLRSESSGKAIIRWGLRTPGKGMATGDMEALAEIVHKYDGTEGSNFIEGGGIVKLDPNNKTQRGGAIELVATEVPKVAVELLEDGENKWLVTGGAGAPDEFYYDSGAGVNMLPAAKPDTVYVDSVPFKEGTVGSLVAGEWGWGDVDTIGTDTIYIFIAGPIDPDSLCTSELSQVRIIYVMSDPTFNRAELSDMASADDFLLINGGVIRIDGFPNNRTIQGVVVDPLANSNSTYNWELYENAFGSTGTKVWPHRGTFHDGRLVYANENDIWMSDVNDPDRFSIGILPADAVVFSLIAGNEIHKVQWMESRDILVIGTDLGEFTVGSRNAITTPDNVLVRRQSSFGSWSAWPLAVVGGNSIYFADRSGTIIREMNFDFNTDSYQTIDITRQLTEIFSQAGIGGGIISLTYQPEPFPILWVVVAQHVIGGNFPTELWGCVINKDEGKYQWFKVDPAKKSDGSGEIATWDVQSVSYTRIKKVSTGWGNSNIGFLAVQMDLSAIRIIDTGMMNVMARIVDPKDGQALSTSGAIAYLDYYGIIGPGVSDNNNATISAVMDHLWTFDKDNLKSFATSKENLENVNFLQDLGGGNRRIFPDDYVGNNSAVGLPYDGTLTPMRLEGGGERGPSQSIIKRISRLFLRLYGSMGGKVGPDGAATETIPNATTPVDGDREVDFPGRHDTDGYISIVHEDPVPFVVLAVSAEINTSEKP